MKEIKGKLKDLIDYIRVVPYQEYKELKGEWEQQNIDLDKAKLEKRKLLKEISKLTNEKFGIIAKYEEDKKLLQDNNESLKTALGVATLRIKELEKALKEKERQRHSTASKNGWYALRVKELEGQVEFLKTHRRSPNLEELKCYTERRKKCEKK